VAKSAWSGYHIDMAGYNEENPYASPEGAAEAAVAEIHGIWRDGDELVVLPRDMKAPKACWVTNETRFVSRCVLISFSRTSLALNGLFFIPLLGLLLYPIAALFFVYRGDVRLRSPVAWLSWNFRVRQNVGVLTTVALVFIAVGLCYLAGFSMSLSVFLVAAPFIVVSQLANVWSDRLLLGLHTRFGENGTYRIRGVHPDYLARLPAYNESDTIAATTIEPGESPFADPAP
jgi:hypothetical protein